MSDLIASPAILREDASMVITRSTLSMASLTLVSMLGCAAPDEPVYDLDTQRSAVVKGSSADIADFPATVALRDTQNAGSVFCTGSLIGPRHVLTAAHCVANLASNPSRVNVAVGVSDATQPPSTSLINVESMAVHPQWTGFPSSGDVDGLDVTNDVAVLKLAQDVPNAQVAYVLPDARIESDLPERASVEIVGFGLDENRVKGVLRRGTAPLRKRTPQLFLAGELGTADSCKYDSGGPVYLLAKDGLFLVGITSREWPGAQQSSCGEGGVYTMPMAYRSFIEAQLGTPLPEGKGTPPGGEPTPPSDAGTPGTESDSAVPPVDSDGGDEQGTASFGDDVGRGSSGGCSAGHASSIAGVWSLLALSLFVRRRRPLQRA